MGVFEFVIIVVAIVFGTGVVRDRQRIKAGYPPTFGRGRKGRRGRNGRNDRNERSGRDGGDFSDCPTCERLTAEFGNVGELRDKLANMSALEERIQVLERIVTDKGGNLADEIDNL